MYESNQFKKGLRVEVDGAPYIMVETQFVKPGKGQSFTRVKIKNLLNGNVIERTYKSVERLPPADVMENDMQFLYADGKAYHFMDVANFEQVELAKEQLGTSWKWLREEMICSVTIYKGNPVSVSLPNFSEMEITYCEPGIKGDTATGATKSATLSTGAEIQVPLFVNQNDVIKIDTRTEQYVERVKK